MDACKYIGKRLVQFLESSEVCGTKKVAGKRRDRETLPLSRKEQRLI